MVEEMVTPIRSPIHSVRAMVVHAVASRTPCPCGAFPPAPELVASTLVSCYGLVGSG